VIILGIETSCDETACGIVEDGKKLLSSAVLSSMDLHKAYGGVVPEIAARSHLEAMMPVVNEALEVAKIDWDDIDAIAVTYGAGLGGSLLVGVMTARTLAITKKKPLYAINHVEAHIYANFLTSASDNLKDSYRLPSKQPEFPMLGLIVSGNHSQLVLWQDHFDYHLLGQTQDDAIGEAFDKVAKVIGLPYPGGPSISKKAHEGRQDKYKLPIARLQNKYDFSFSGLKTATLRLAQKEVGADHTLPSIDIADKLTDAQVADIAASFQYTAIKTVTDKTVQAYEEFMPKTVVIGGGVASDRELRKQLAERLPLGIEYTDPKLCTDNGAMVASLGSYHHLLKKPTADPYSLEIKPNLSM
jgi:N6-L-threonylcarbamoyladenine synthase